MASTGLMTPAIPYNQIHPGSPAHRRVRHGHARTTLRASVHRMGRRVMAAAQVLHYGVSIPVRKVRSVLRALTGVGLSQSAITQDALCRTQGVVGDAYERLGESVRESAVVHTDDTCWRVGGEGALLMAFETEDATVYQVRGRHRNEGVREVVPGDYVGVMVAVRGRSFGKRLSELLREVIELWESQRRGESVDYAGETERLRRALSHHLRDRTMAHPLRLR